MENKSNKVLEHLKEHNTITTWEAIQLYSATRLSSIIYNLRKRGYNIESRWLEQEDKYGNTTRYTLYTLKGGGMNE